MLALVDVSPSVREALKLAGAEVTESSAVLGIERAAPGGLEAIDAFVLGASVRDPVQAASQANRVAPFVSVVILGVDLAQCERIRAALRFAPLIGRDVQCIDGDGERVVGPILEAARRTRARRSHQHTLRVLRSKPEPVESRQAPLRERYAAQLMELAPVGIVATDAACRVVSANAEAARILDRSEREMLGRSLTGELLEEDGGDWSQLVCGASEAGPRGPTTLQRRQGPSIKTLEGRAVTIRDTLGGGHLLVLQDVTDRVALEHQKHVALEQAQTASRLKDEFLATISHELRTPLNAILGWARLLRTTIVPEKRERALETIERNALAQSQLIDDLLDITRITTGKLRLEVEEVQLIPIIEAAIETVRPSIEAKQLRLTQTLDTLAGSVTGDPHRLQQVFWNLLSNAVKFAPKGAGHIRVLLERSGSHVELTVSDNGPGISEDFLPHVFESFRQADASASRRHGGLGLGLAISKHLVELHGGTIHAHSEGLGLGASFTVRIPVAPIRGVGRRVPERTQRSDAHAPFDAAGELLNVRVLVIDDEQDSRELVADNLATCGAVVRLAASVTDALAAVDDFRPDVIVSDIGMPGEDGYSFIAKLRARPRERGGATPVAALTAYARAEDRRRALQAGFQMHIVKPVEPSELVTVISTLARMAKLIR